MSSVIYWTIFLNALVSAAATWAVWRFREWRKLKLSQMRAVAEPPTDIRLTLMVIEEDSILHAASVFADQDIEEMEYRPALPWNSQPSSGQIWLANAMAESIAAYKKRHMEHLIKIAGLKGPNNGRPELR